MIELKENDIVSDFLNEEETNKYSITTMQKEETVISIEVSEGDPVVKVSDYGTLNITKTKDPKTNNIHITIPPADNIEKSTAMTPIGGIFYDSFRYSSTFKFLII